MIKKNYNLSFWLKKMYLLQQIPFSDKRIQRGLNDVDLWLCSTGGSGSNLLKAYLDPYIRVRSPYLAALLTHHKEPVEHTRKGFKAIYLHADPFSVLRSVKRRDLVSTNIKKLNNSRALVESDELLLQSVFDQFDAWTQSNVSYPILCVKYEALFDSWEIISEFIGFELSDFPRKKNRVSGKVEIDTELSQKFDLEYRKWKQFPAIRIIE